MPKITELPADTTPDGTEIIPLVSPSAGTTDGMTVRNLMKAAALIPDSTIPGSALSDYRIKRSNNGTTTTETASVIQTGWAVMNGNGSAQVTQLLTFPSAYTNPPIVVAVFGGDTNGVTSTYGSGGASVNAGWAGARNITKTGFVVTATTTGSPGSWSSSQSVYVQWIAIGI